MRCQNAEDDQTADRRQGGADLGENYTFVGLLYQVIDVRFTQNYTSTLDILESICRKNKFTFARLDGKTKQTDRPHYINSL